MNLLLASNNDTIRTRWENALKDHYRIFQATSIPEMSGILEKKGIELVLLHNTLGDEGAVRAIPVIRGRRGAFIFSDRPNNEEGFRYLQLQCSGYSNSYIAANRLQLAVKTVLSGMVWTGSSLMKFLLDKTADLTPPQSSDSLITNFEKGTFGSLSNREHQVAGLAAEGLSNKEIAERLAISERTVKSHLSSIFSKTGLNGRISLVKYYKFQ